MGVQNLGTIFCEAVKPLTAYEWVYHFVTLMTLQYQQI